MRKGARSVTPLPNRLAFRLAFLLGGAVFSPLTPLPIQPTRRAVSANGSFPRMASGQLLIRLLPVGAPRPTVRPRDPSWLGRFDLLDDEDPPHFVFSHVRRRCHDPLALEGGVGEVRAAP